jgi:hypothetical protein
MNNISAKAQIRKFSKDLKKAKSNDKKVRKKESVDQQKGVTEIPVEAEEINTQVFENVPIDILLYGK